VTAHRCGSEARKPSLISRDGRPNRHRTGGVSPARRPRVNDRSWRESLIALSTQDRHSNRLKADAKPIFADTFQFAELRH
jgi:hypothetical protein